MYSIIHIDDLTCYFVYTETSGDQSSSGRKHSCECSGQDNIRIVMPLSVSILNCMMFLCMYVRMCVCIVGYISYNMHFTAFIRTNVFVRMDINEVIGMFKCCNRHQWRQKQIRYAPLLYS